MRHQAILMCLLLLSCSEDLEKKAKRESDRAEFALFSDPKSAAPEIERRIRARLSVEEGSIVFESEYYTITVVPITTPWKVNCGYYLSATFADASFNIAEGNIPREKCTQLAVIASNKIREVLGRPIAALND
jgi:hypothetical protein